MKKATEIFSNCKSVRVYLNSCGEKKVQFTFDSFVLTCGDNGRKLPTFGVSDQADKNGAGVALINSDGFTTKLAEVKEFLQNIKATDEQIDKAYDEDVTLYEEKAENEEQKSEETKEGNEIFKALVDEAIRENEQQAGKIVGKILAEVKENEVKVENEAGIPSGRYFRYTYYAGRLTMSFVEYHPTGEEIWGERPYAVNAFGMGIKKYDVWAHKGAKRSFTIFLAETPEQVRFMSK